VSSGTLNLAQSNPSDSIYDNSEQLKSVSNHALTKLSHMKVQFYVHNNQVS